MTSDATAPAASSSPAWEAVAASLTRHHHNPDLQAAQALYSAVAAHTLRGQPVWPMLVAPPGSAKTDLLEALDGLPHTHLIDTVTPNTFLSGQIHDNKRPQSPASSSLLHRIGASGIIIYPDFSTILSMNKTNRGLIVSDMRRIYDGHLHKEYGTDEQAARDWKGRITFAAGATPEVDRHYGVLGPLGERFIMIRWGRQSTEAAIRAMKQDSQAKSIEIRQAVHALIQGVSKQEPIAPTAIAYQLASLAEFTAIARTHIHRSSGSGREIEFIPTPETPSRIAQQLMQLAKGSALLMNHTEVMPDDYALSKRVALDCIPGKRRAIIECLLTDPKANVVGAETSIFYAKEELAALGLLESGTGYFTKTASDLLFDSGLFTKSNSPYLYNMFGRDVM